ncbi:MAG: hypothetical protein J6Y07_00295 [Alphaproteobacteria bacterium]|nr:hypothetical protein [Alphaproteobacteria bacterium]
MCFTLRNRKEIKNSVPAHVIPDSLDWYLEECRKNDAWYAYAKWVYEQFGNEETAKKLRKYNDAMNALVEEIFGKKAY